MKPLMNLSWSKLTGKPANNANTPAAPSAQEADTTDKHEVSAQGTTSSAHDTPHEARPDQPEAASLTNRLFRTLKSGPRQQQQQPTDIELSSFSPKF